MNVAVRVLLGALTGWLTGKVADGERAGKISSSGSVQVRDAIYGIVGALLGNTLFFWIVIGDGNSFGVYATTVLGAVTVSGAARLIRSRLDQSRLS